jgi:hypothetical protein
MKKDLIRAVGLGALLTAILAGCPNGGTPTTFLDPNIDNDGDGWAGVDGDLDDTNPLVNPGAYEIVGNGIDDDCDPSTSDAVSAPDCSSSAVFAGVPPLQFANAMELCRTTTADPPLSERRWGVISVEFLTADGQVPSANQLSDMSNHQIAILTEYGTGGVQPRSGATMAGMSTGFMRDAADAGFVPPAPGTDFGYTGNPPASYLAAHGGQLPASSGCNGVCPAGSGANDSVNVRLTIRVPTNAKGFSYNHMFFTAEYKSWTCSAYNDYHLALLTSGSPVIPSDRNIAFDAANNPISVNSGLFQACFASGCYTCTLGTALLAGTGMDINNEGGGTGWLTTTAPVIPGETIILELMVFDVSDGIYDSNVLFDQFRWIPSDTTVGTGTAN